MRLHWTSAFWPFAGGCALIALGLTVAACSGPGKRLGKVDPKYGVRASPRVVQPGQPVPKGGGVYHVGKPYQVAGRWYRPQENRRYRVEGVASWYGEDFHGRLTANGEVYDMAAISAAHPTMPIPSYARVTNLKNGRSLIVRVNDRGPYHDDRIIDLSGKAAELLQFRGRGTARVRVEYVGPAALEGSDDRRLMATLSEGRAAPPPSAVRVAAARPFVPPVRYEERSERAAAAPAPRRAPIYDDPAHLPAHAAPAEPRPSFNTGPASQRVTASALPPLPASLFEPEAPAAGVLRPPPTAYAPAPPLATGRGLY